MVIYGTIMCQVCSSCRDNGGGCLWFGYLFMLHFLEWRLLFCSLISRSFTAPYLLSGKQHVLILVACVLFISKLNPLVIFVYNLVHIGYYVICFKSFFFFCCLHILLSKDFCVCSY
ncbi:hypothetical protein CsSME_00022633 [Camellia sinensis var. sinensis]